MDLIKPTWPAPRGVQAFSTTRLGGVSPKPFASLNLGLHVGDDPRCVETNRALVNTHLSLPSEPVWLNQVHGKKVLSLPLEVNLNTPPSADALFTREINQVCVVMSADCLPVFFCDLKDKAVAAAHAGWRGLLDGILENTLSYFSNPENVLAWLGPAIGASAFEVGNEIKQAFEAKNPLFKAAFMPYNGKWLADIYALARFQLKLSGVKGIYGGEYCTFTDPNRFFSYRRDGQTGRQASLIWLSRF